MNEINEPDVELEEQFILRLPLIEAEKIKELLRKKPAKLKKILKIDIDVFKGTGFVFIGKKKLYAYLKKLPTILESHKTNIVDDKSTLFKTADVSHVLECYENPLENFKTESPHGYTPPLKNVRNNRFRKTMVNLEMAEETEMITKELYYLISTDLDAVSTRFELLDVEGNKLPKNNQTGCRQFFIKIKRHPINSKIISFLVKILFGHISSSDSESAEIDVKYKTLFL